MSKSKGKSKAKRKIVKKANGEPPRTARVRFVEPPMKPDGNPFFAVRVRRELLGAFRKYAARAGVEATVLVRTYMSKVTGVSAEADNGDE